MTVQTDALACHRVVPAPEDPITWVAPNDARDHDRLSRWCRAVGPVLVDAAPDPAPPARIDRLVVVTWNIHVGGGNVEDLVARLRRGEFTDGRAVSQFALLLQEAYRQGPDVPADVSPGSSVPRAIVESPPNGARRDVRDLARRLALHVLYAPTMRNGRSGTEDRGTAILSTMALTNLEVIELPFEHQRRVAVAATVAGTTASGAEWTLRLVDVQADTALALTRGGPMAARRRQVEALVDALGPAEAGSAPMVLGGDFNTWLGTREPAIHVLDRAFPATPRGGAGATWRGTLGMHAALDHVFVRGRVRSAATRRLASRFGSDHYPLLTVVEF